MKTQRQAGAAKAGTVIQRREIGSMVPFDKVTVPRVEQNGPAGKGEFIYVDISSVDNKLKRITDPKTLKVVAAPSRAKQRLKSGDVLVSMTRPNLNAVALVPQELEGAVGSTGFHVLRANESTEPRWLYYAVQTPHFVSAMSKLVQGALYPAVRPKDIRAFEIPHPPVDQQKQIVAEIEKQFSRLGDAVANLKRVKANLKRYKAAVLKAAVEGRLVETEAELARREGRSYETGAQLLQRILETRRSQWKGKSKYKDPVAPDTTDLPELPEGWVWANLDQVCIKITDGTHHSPENLPQGDYKYITSKNVREFRLELDDITFVNKVTHNEIYARCDVRKDDVLYVKDGVNTGLAAKNTLDEPFSLLSSVGVFRTVPELSPDYLVAYLNSPDVRDRMLANIAGVAITRLTLSKLKVSVVAVPPPTEQRRILMELDRRLSVIGQAGTQVDVNDKRSDRLRQSILESAFSGPPIPEKQNSHFPGERTERIEVQGNNSNVAMKLLTDDVSAETRESIMKDLIEALRKADGWVTAQEAFRSCGVSDGVDTDTIERLYAELREYVRPGVIQVERRGDEDWLRLAKHKGD